MRKRQKLHLCYRTPVQFELRPIKGSALKVANSDRWTFILCKDCVTCSCAEFILQTLHPVSVTQCSSVGWREGSSVRSQAAPLDSEEIFADLWQEGEGKVWQKLQARDRAGQGSGRHWVGQYTLAFIQRLNHFHRVAWTQVSWDEGLDQIHIWKVSRGNLFSGWRMT